jgi:thiamine monophosphate synthase
VAAPENVGLWAEELTQQAPHATFGGFLIRAAIQEAQHAAADAWHIQRTTMSTHLSNTGTAPPNKVGLTTMRAMKAARSR